MRPIDADKLKEVLSDTFGSRIVKEIIDNQPTVNEWTPCSERLPENGDGVLFTINKRIEIGVYLKKRDIWICNDEYGTVYDHSSVVAWMPLPEPYKEVEE